MARKVKWILHMQFALAMVLMVSACTPTVKLEVPDRPIVINLNVKIEQEVRVKLEKGVEEVVQNNPDIF
jgi:hypothetical protein